MRILRFFIAGIFVVPFVLAVIYFTTQSTPPPPHHDGQVFRLPAMMLGCLTFEPANGENIYGWRFEQPITILVEHGKTVTIDAPYWDMQYEQRLSFCTRVEANDRGVVNIKGGTMNFNPSQVDTYPSIQDAWNAVQAGKSGTIYVKP